MAKQIRVAAVVLVIAAFGAACDAITSIAASGADFGGTTATVHCDRRFVDDGGQPSAFCQEVVDTVAAAQFADDCHDKFHASPGSGLCPRPQIIAGCEYDTINGDGSHVWDWFYDVSGSLDEAGSTRGRTAGRRSTRRCRSTRRRSATSAPIDALQWRRGARLSVTAPAPADVVAVAPANAAEPAKAPTLEPPAENAVYVELLGNGLDYSIDYERMLTRWNVGLRAGASFVSYKISNANGAGNLTLATFPFVASYYFGTTHHKLQLGLGATILYVAAATDSAGEKFEGSGTGLGVAATGVVGYRYVPGRRGITFGAGFTPLVRASKGFLPWGGAFVGYAF